MSALPPAEERPGDLVGTTLAGRYRIVEKLGEGAMGTVYLGEHVKIGRRDAIKVLRDDLSTDREAIARFVRGTRNVSMIRHPNICTIYDYSDTAEGLQFVAMEYVPGETLKDLLQREGTLPLADAVHIAVQVAEALEAAHVAGIVHRDLKPANIMLAPQRDGRRGIKVVDFDIAKGPADGGGDEVTRHGFVVGTPEYMSPEHLIGDRLDGRSDTYSLALVVFRMLTGTLPFATQDAQEMLIKRLTERPMLLVEARPDVVFPEALERAVHRALSRRAADRQESVAAFGREIAAATAGLEPFAAPLGASVVTGAVPGPPAPAEIPATRLDTPRSPTPQGGGTGAPDSRRRALRAVAGIAGAALLVAAVAVGALAWSRSDADPAEGDLAVEDAPLVRAEVATATPDAPVVPEDVEDVEDVDPPGGTSPTPVTGGPGTGAPPVAPADAGAVEDALYRLLFRIGPPYPPRATLLAIRDTAEAVWNSPSAPRDQRGFAAYVAGNALVPAGDTVGAVVWAQRAVELRPDPTYQRFLQAYRDFVR